MDKRLDLLSSVIRKNGTISDLAELEHAYAPPYSSAKDPVNVAGFVAENVLHDGLKIMYGCQLDEMEGSTTLIDVRTSAEYLEGSIPGAINIPLDELREKLDELDPDKEIVVYCQVGLRGYLAQRILIQNGFNSVFNLSGGYILWKVCADEGCFNQELVCG